MIQIIIGIPSNTLCQFWRSVYFSYYKSLFLPCRKFYNHLKLLHYSRPQIRHNQIMFFWGGKGVSL